MYKKLPTHRYHLTIDFMQRVLPTGSTILDLGVRNPFTEIMEKTGYKVINSNGEDLDLFPEIVTQNKVDAVCAFQILEHLVSPFNVLKAITAKKLITTVPLNLWFAKAYRNDKDEWDRHFHEFEDWQYDWLLSKSGWNIKVKEKWTAPVDKVGIRPLMRKYIPRYYAVYAEK